MPTSMRCIADGSGTGSDHRSPFWQLQPAWGRRHRPREPWLGRYDIGEWAWSFGYDPDNSSLLWHANSSHQWDTTGPFTATRALDALYKQEQATADPGARQQIFHQIHEFYLKELPFITLYSPTNFSMVHKGMHNYQPSPFEADTITSGSGGVTTESVRYPFICSFAII